MNNLARHFLPGCVVHLFCNHQALEILSNDGHTTLSAKLRPFVEILDSGNRWADEGLRYVNHYYDPHSKKGIMGFSPADRCFVEYFQRALDFYQKGKPANSFFCLGSALHLLQDICVPHHAMTKVLCGHREYENWVARHYPLFRAREVGCYTISDPLKLFHNNALQAAEYSELLHNPKNSMKMEITRELLSLAQRSGAALLHLFNCNAGLV